MYYRVLIKVRVCMYKHDTRYTKHDIDAFRVYTVTCLAWKAMHWCVNQVLINDQ